MSNIKSLQGWYNHYQQKHPTDVEGLCQRLGISCIGEHLDDDVSGYIERKSEYKYRIVYNKSHPLVRQRFTIAHELGHFYLHRSILGTGTGDTKAYRSNVPGHTNPQITQQHEREANSFAADLLMPKRAIEYFRDENLSFEDIRKKFDVSKSALEFRLSNIGIEIL